VVVRAGTILPRQPLVQSTSETPNGPLKLDVYPGPDCNGEIYFDDGHSMAFQKGRYLRQKIRCSIDPKGKLSIAFESPEGQYSAWWNVVDVVVHGWTTTRNVTSSNLRLVRVAKPAANDTVEFKIPGAPTSGEIIIG
jgi:alpha-glucosidase